MRSSRYMNDDYTDDVPATPGGLGGPTGIGTSAARIVPSLLSTTPQRMRSFVHTPFQPVGSLSRPSFYMPYSTSFSPYLDRTRDHTVDWARQMGMLDASPGIWDERKLRTFDFGLAGAATHPDATPEQLDLTTDWFTWGTYGDDYYPSVFGWSGNLAAARASNERLSQLMPVEPEAAPPLPVTALERGLADLWQRSIGPMSIPARRAFRAAVEEMIESWLWSWPTTPRTTSPTPSTMSRCGGKPSART